MPTVKAARDMNASSSKIWGVLSDYSNIQAFHPRVQTVDQLSDSDRGLGAKRRCNFYDKTSAVEEIIDWNEGQSFTVVITEAAMPVVDATAIMGVNKIDEHRSQVFLELTYTPKWGILGKIIDVVMLRMAMRRIFSQVLKGLQHHVETGELIGNGKPTSSVSEPKATQLQQG